ncbi:hypothetical protein JXA84_00850 [candidate division WOR-3 bacterium]|nr:hypothetical protein [candidate division WOR-3 bacterium]
MIFILFLISIQAEKLGLKIPPSELSEIRGMNAEFISFPGPDGRTVDSISCGSLNSSEEHCVFFLRYRDSLKTKFRIVSVDHAGTLIANSPIFPHSDGLYSIERAGFVDVLNGKKGIYVKISQTTSTLSRDFDYIFILDREGVSQFYSLLSRECFNEGGRDMNSLLYFFDNRLCLAQSPEYWISIHDYETDIESQKAVWTIPGTILFEPDYFGYAPKFYLLGEDSIVLHYGDLLFFFRLPEEESIFPSCSWNSLSSVESHHLFKLWSAFLGYNFAVNSSSYEGFDPSFRIVGGYTRKFVELIIFLQDREINSGGDLFSLKFSNPEHPDAFFESKLTPHNSSPFDSVIIETFGSVITPEVTANVVSQSERSSIILVEIPVKDFKQAIGIESDLIVVSAIFRYRDIDDNEVSFSSIPSGANRESTSAWADIIFGTLTLK